MAEPIELPKIGELLAEKYRVSRLLGSGGMGAVYQAHHEILDKEVAIKLLLPHVAESQVAVTRFLNEAKAVARLSNEHVAAVLDVGMLPNGCAYMVLEYLEGCDLAQTLQARGALPMNEAVEYVIQALEAVAQAHAVGIIHRDLKPANLFLTRRADGLPMIKVLDFGISKATTSDVTTTSTTIGSPAYMSPEQIKSAKHVDPRSDIWSIGVVLYQLLTNEQPFKGEQYGEIFFAVLKGAHTPLSALKPELPSPLSDAVGRCLERDPNRRFQNVGELAEALKDYAFPEAKLCVERIHRMLAIQKGAKEAPADPSSWAPLPAAQQKPEADPQPAIASATKVDPVQGTTPDGPVRRHRAPLYVAGAVGLAAVVGVVLVLGGAFSAPSEAPVPAPQAARPVPKLLPPPPPPAPEVDSSQIVKGAEPPSPGPVDQDQPSAPEAKPSAPLKPDRAAKAQPKPANHAGRAPADDILLDRH